MKTLFLNSFFFFSLAFGFVASDSPFKQVEINSASEVYSPSGTLAVQSNPLGGSCPCFTVRGESNFRVKIVHLTGTQPPNGSMDLFINGVDTGVNVSVGSLINVPANATSVWINYPIGGGLTVLYAGLNQTEISNVCDPDLVPACDPD